MKLDNDSVAGSCWESVSFVKIAVVLYLRVSAGLFSPLSIFLDRFE
jgi:hypothetical protein